MEYKRSNFSYRSDHNFAFRGVQLERGVVGLTDPGNSCSPTGFQMRKVPSSFPQRRY